MVTKFGFYILKGTEDNGKACITASGQYVVLKEMGCRFYYKILAKYLRKELLELPVSSGGRIFPDGYLCKNKSDFYITISNYSNVLVWEHNYV